MKIGKLNFGNSVYQTKSSGSFDGLTMKGGRLVNNRPDGQTGIAQAADIRKSMKRAEKIMVVAKGTAMGEMMSDMGECSDCD
jgi:hypothetical protein